MRRAAPLALAVLLLVAGSCTFERRAPDEATTAGDTAEASGEAEAIRAARSALEAFQARRRAGDDEGARALLAPEAVLLLNGRPLAWREAPASADPLLGPGASLGRWRLSAGARRLGEEVLFSLAYGPGDAPSPEALETVLLMPGPDGWRVRLLHRTGPP